MGNPSSNAWTRGVIQATVFVLIGGMTGIMLLLDLKLADFEKPLIGAVFAFLLESARKSINFHLGNEARSQHLKNGDRSKPE